MILAAHLSSKATVLLSLGSSWTRKYEEVSSPSRVSVGYRSLKDSQFAVGAFSRVTLQNLHSVGLLAAQRAVVEGVCVGSGASSCVRDGRST